MCVVQPALNVQKSDLMPRGILSRQPFSFIISQSYTIYTGMYKSLKYGLLIKYKFKGRNTPIPRYATYAMHYDEIWTLIFVCLETYLYPYVALRMTSLLARPTARTNLLAKFTFSLSLTLLLDFCVIQRASEMSL